MTSPLIEIGLIVGVLILAGVMIRLGVLQKRDSTHITRSTADAGTTEDDNSD